MPYRMIIVSTDRDTCRQLAQVATNDDFFEMPEAIALYPGSSRFNKMLPRPDGAGAAVLVELGDGQAGLDAIETIREEHPKCIVAAIHPKTDTERILAALRAGASEFLVPPFDLRNLKRSMATDKLPALPAPSPRKRGKLLCFLPAQSGNGATTIALHAASAIAAESEDGVLLAELDFHCGSLIPRLGFDPRGLTVANMLEEGDYSEEAWSRVTQKWRDVSVLPGPQEARRISYQRLQNLPPLLHSALRTYGCVIADLPCAISASCRDVVGMADEVYIVCTPEVVSLHLARRRFNELMDIGLPQRKVQLVVNRADSNRLLPLEDIRRIVGLPVRWSLTNDYNSAVEASRGTALVSQDCRLGVELYHLGCAAMNIHKPAAANSGPFRRFLAALGMTAIRAAG